MKRTGVREYVERLTGWHDPMGYIRHQPFVCLSYEMSIEEARRRWPESRLLLESEKPVLVLGNAVSVYTPFEVEVDPNV